MFEYIVDDFEGFDLSEEFICTEANYNKIFYYEYNKNKYLVFYNNESGLVKVDLYKDVRKKVLDSAKKPCKLKDIKTCLKKDLYFLKYRSDSGIEILKLFFDEADRKEFILKQERISKAIDQREEIEKLEAAKKMTEEVKQRKSRADKEKKYELFYDIEETLYSVQNNLRSLILREDIQTLSLEQLESALVYFQVLDNELSEKSFKKKHDMSKVREVKKEKAIARRLKKLEQMKKYLIENKVLKITVTELCKILNVKRQYFYENKLNIELKNLLKENYYQLLSEEIEKINRE